MKSLVPSIKLAFYSARNRIAIIIVVAASITACTHKSDITAEAKPLVEVASSPSDSVQEKKLLNVIVLPPYDVIAGAGISPDITKSLENVLKKEAQLDVMKFPYQKLINANYHMVYDKKYCREIIEIVDPDIIVMSRLDLAKKTGNMDMDRWDFEIKIYDVSSDQQRKSISGQSLRAEGIDRTIHELRENLVDDILEARK
jgi:hypothetical protein